MKQATSLISIMVPCKIGQVSIATLLSPSKLVPMSKFWLHDEKLYHFCVVLCHKMLATIAHVQQYLEYLPFSKQTANNFQLFRVNMKILNSLTKLHMEVSEHQLVFVKKLNWQNYIMISSWNLYGEKA
jgi:hypothetical protein